MKKSSKILSIIMALVMVISIIPMSSITASAATYSGTCGDNLTWTFNDSTGTLTISGTGAMGDYYDQWLEYWENDSGEGEYLHTYYFCTSLARPWESYKDKITKVIINKGVTALDDCAFADCKNLTSVSISDTVVDMGGAVFSGCSSLKSIVIPNSVKSLDSLEYYENCRAEGLFFPTYRQCLRVEGFFEGCTSLTDVTIVDGLTEIGDEAFLGCSSLKSIVLPNSVEKVGGALFYGCSSLENVTLSNKITSLDSYTNEYYDKFQSYWYESYGFFEGCSSLKNIVIPDSVKKVDAELLIGCSSLETITLSKGIAGWGERYDENGFETDFYDGSCDIYFNGTMAEWNYSIPTGGMIYCTDGCFEGICGDDAYWIFDESTSTLNIFGTGVIGKCGDSYITYDSPWYRVLEKTQKVIINNDITEIADGAFWLCENLTEVIIGDSVTTIGGSAFESCNNLKSVTIGDSVTTIGGSAFSPCDNLTSFTVDGNNQYYSNDEYGVLFNKDKTILVQYPIGKKMTNYSIPNSVMIIENNAFHRSNNITDIYFYGTEEEWKKISGNNYYYLKNTSIHYIGHIFDDWSTVTSVTCTDDGLEKRTCSECGKEETKVIPALGHKYSSIVTAPTCTEKGYTTHTCTECGHNYIDNYVNAKGHTYIETITNPTCIKDGYVTCTCECGDKYIASIIDATGHDDLDVDAYCDHCDELLCDHDCHKGGITGFFWKITNFFNRIFGSNKQCECGVAHY